MPLAMARPPQDLAPPSWGTAGRGFWYAEFVQPVLDKHCAGCHGTQEPAAKPLLTGEKTRQFSVSYEALIDPKEEFVNFISTSQGRNILLIEPKTWGSPSSRLTELILSGHPDANGKKRINVSPAERRTIFAWIDLNIPFYGAYFVDEEAEPGCGAQSGIPYASGGK
jgi:hypothetical protein